MLPKIRTRIFFRFFMRMIIFQRYSLPWNKSFIKYFGRIVNDKVMTSMSLVDQKNHQGERNGAGPKSCLNHAKA